MMPRTARAAVTPPQSWPEFLANVQRILDASYNGIRLPAASEEHLRYWHARGESAAQVIARGLGAPTARKGTATKALLVVSALLLAAPLFAGPITAGAWTATPAPNATVDRSEDCATCGAIWQLPHGTEMLTDGFGYEDWSGATLLSQQTDYTDAPGLTWDGLSFSYANGHGFTSSSWGGSHQRLFRQVFPNLTRYWLAIEDLPSPIIWDWNDAVYAWTEDAPGPPCLTACAPPPVCLGDCEPPAVPEPALLALLVWGMLAVRVRRR